MNPPSSLPVSVLVPTIGREKLLRQCLPSILACEPAASEVLVVDQSGSATVEALVRELSSSRLRLIHCDGRGVARATNLGLRRVSHDVVLVTHDDCTVSKQWIEVGHRLAGKVPGGIVTGRVLAPEGSYVPATKASIEPQDFTGQPPGYGMLWPNNMVLYASAAVEIGFDERSSMRYAEDTDFGYRWLRAGRPLRYEPELVVWHHDWRQPPQLVQTHVGYLRSLGAFFAKHLYERDPDIRRVMDAYLRWAFPIFANGLLNRRPRWEYAERELLPHFAIGLAQGWIEASRLDRAAAKSTRSGVGPRLTSSRTIPDERGRPAPIYSGARRERRSRGVNHPMVSIKRSLGSVRRRLLGLNGLDSHLASLEARSEAIDTRLASIDELVRGQHDQLVEVSEKIEAETRARRDNRLVADYLSSTRFPVLHLGCGDMVRSGWLNTDAVPVNDDVIELDMRGPYPFESESFAAVYTEHAIEHLDIDSARAMLSNCCRVLKPGGLLRIATPDQRKIVELLSNESQEAQSYVRWACDRFNLGPPHTPAIVINNFFRDWGHQLIYDEPTLTALLRDVGFGDVRRMEIGHSQHPELDGAEMHGRLIAEEWNQIETMVLEATRPVR